MTPTYDVQPSAHGALIYKNGSFWLAAPSVQIAQEVADAMGRAAVPANPARLSVLEGRMGMLEIRINTLEGRLNSP